MPTATEIYYSRIRAVQAMFRPRFDRGELPEQTPGLVLKEVMDPYSPDFGKMIPTLESVWIVSTGANFSTGARPGISVLVPCRLGAEKVVVGSHVLALRSNPEHIASIARNLQHQFDQKSQHDAADAKLPSSRVNVGVRIPGER